MEAEARLMPSQVAPCASGIENQQVIAESKLWGHSNGPTLAQRIGIGWDNVNEQQQTRRNRRSLVRYRINNQLGRTRA